MRVAGSLSSIALVMIICAASVVAVSAQRSAPAGSARSAPATASPDNTPGSEVNPNVEVREILLRRDQVLAAAQRNAATAGKEPQQQRRGLAGVLGRARDDDKLDLAEGAKTLLRAQAGAAARAGTHYVVVVIGSEEDRDKVRNSLAGVQSRVQLLFVNHDVNNAQVDHTPLKPGGVLAAVGNLTATNLWFYRPSLSASADGPPDQMLPLRAASGKTWTGLFGASGDLATATTGFNRSSSPSADASASTGNGEVARTGNAPAASASAASAPAASASAASAVSIGDVLVPKIANIKVTASPSDTAKTVVTLTKAEEVVVIGPEKGGFVQVQGANGQGWVRLSLFNKQ